MQSSRWQVGNFHPADRSIDDAATSHNHDNNLTMTTAT
jgi:hypothetical protein